MRRRDTGHVRRLRPEHTRPDPADRLVWAPDDAAQCDLWFPPTKIPLEDGTRVSPPVLVIVAAHSRFTTAVMIPTRKTEDLLLGSWELIGRLGRVPRRLIWDNEGGIGQRGRLTQPVTAFAGTLATRVMQPRPYDPESKRIVERRNRWLETSFLPGRTLVASRWAPPLSQVHSASSSPRRNHLPENGPEPGHSTAWKIPRV